MANYKISLTTLTHESSNVKSLLLKISVPDSNPAIGPSPAYIASDLAITVNGAVSTFNLSNETDTANYTVTFTGTLPSPNSIITIQTQKQGDTSNLLYIDPKESGFTINGNIASKTIPNFKITKPGTTNFSIDQVDNVAFNVADPTPIIAIKAPTTTNSSIDATVVSGSLPPYLTPIIPTGGSLDVSVNLSIEAEGSTNTTDLQFSVSQDPA